jgi:hypothetical protein
MMKKAQESEAARFAPFWLLRKLEKSCSSQGGRHIGSLKIREVEGGVMDALGERLYCFPMRASTPWVMYCIVHSIFKRVECATSAYENSLWLWGLRRQGEIAEL